MTSPDRQCRTRIHAALVHFPVSAWTGAALLQLSMPFHDRAELAGVDVSAAIALLTWVGVASASLAAMAGLIEFARLSDDSRIAATGSRHMLLMGSAFSCFLLAALSHPSSGVMVFPRYGEYALHALGLASVAAGGHLGGRLNVLADRACVSDNPVDRAQEAC